MPEFAGDRAGIEEIGTDGDHHIDIAGFNNLPAHLGLAMTTAGGLGGHNKSGPALLAQIAMEIGDPEVIAVADLLGLVDPRQTEGETAIILYPFGIDHIDVEGRIGHDKVALAKDRVHILVEGVGLADIAFQPVHCQIHLG